MPLSIVTVAFIALFLQPGVGIGDTDAAPPSEQNSRNECNNILSLNLTLHRDACTLRENIQIQCSGESIRIQCISGENVSECAWSINGIQQTGDSLRTEFGIDTGLDYISFTCEARFDHYEFSCSSNTPASSSVTLTVNHENDTMNCTESDESVNITCDPNNFHDVTHYTWHKNHTRVGAVQGVNTINHGKMITFKCEERFNGAIFYCSYRLNGQLFTEKITFMVLPTPETTTPPTTPLTTPQAPEVTPEVTPASGSGSLQTQTCPIYMFFLSSYACHKCMNN